MENEMLAQMTLRILLAAFLGGLIGLERSSGDRPAGLRTHVLVATGSALLMVVSIYGIDGYPQYRDPSRIASQVVSGIGFLGAGTILHEGLTVKGLTTAASLWIVSAIGLTVGCGMLAVGIFTTVITLGAKGSVALIADDMYRMDPFEADAVDTTAAGDTYLGALAAQLSQGLDIIDAMKWASAAGALATTRAGAQRSIPTFEEVRRLLA